MTAADVLTSSTLHQQEALLPQSVSSQLDEYFSSRCYDVDSGRSDIIEGLRFLASHGLVGNTDLALQAAVIRQVSRSCMSSAFALWAQSMVIHYLDRADSVVLNDRAAALRTASLAGSTAMAGAFQDADGYRPLEVEFRPDGDDLLISGTIRWASNLHPDGFVIVLGARDTDANRVIVAVPSDADGLAVDPFLDLLALGGTASASLHLDAVRVPPDWVITRDMGSFIGSIRPTFLLLQSAFCLGLADAALGSVAARIDTAFDGFRAEYSELSSRHDRLVQRHGELLIDPSHATALIEMRLAGSELAQQSVSLETRVLGGAGYLATSPTARRVREAAFLPIQSPTEGHLRWQLASSE